MIAGILPSGDGYPWAPTGMTTERWRTMPVHVFAIRELHVTQPGVLFDSVFWPNEPVGGDPYPHVVVWQGRCYLEDGHHRLMRALCEGSRTIMARRYVVAKEWS